MDADKRNKLRKYLSYASASLILIICVVWLCFSSNDIADDQLVIAFIGVLATFIVVGNYAQTSHIEDNMGERMREYKDTINDKIVSIQDAMEGCKTDIEEAKNDRRLLLIKNKRLELRLNHFNARLEQNTMEHDELGGEIEELQKDIKSVETSLNNQIGTSETVKFEDLARFFALFIGKETDIRKSMQLYARMSNPNEIYSVKLRDGRAVQATIAISDNFDKLTVTKTNKEDVDLNDIEAIAGVKFDLMNFLYGYKLTNHIPVRDNKSQVDEISSNRLQKDWATGIQIDA